MGYDAKLDQTGNIVNSDDMPLDVSTDLIDDRRTLPDRNELPDHGEPLIVPEFPKPF